MQKAGFFMMRIILLKNLSEHARGTKKGSVLEAWSRLNGTAQGPVTSFFKVLGAEVCVWDMFHHFLRF